MRKKVLIAVACFLVLAVIVVFVLATRGQSLTVVVTTQSNDGYPLKGVKVRVEDDEKPSDIEGSAKFVRRFRSGDSVHAVVTWADGRSETKSDEITDDEITDKFRRLTFVYRTVARTSGHLILDSQPSAATVYVDGDPRGPTPLTIEAQFGEHRVKFSKSGYRDVERTVLVSGETAKLNETLIANQVRPVPYPVRPGPSPSGSEPPVARPPRPKPEPPPTERFAEPDEGTEAVSTTEPECIKTGRALLAAGKNEAAVDALGKCNASGLSAEAWMRLMYMKGVALYNSKRYAEAADVLQQLVDGAGKHEGLAYYYLGLARYQLEEYGAAAGALQDGVQRYQHSLPASRKTQINGEAQFTLAMIRYQEYLGNQEDETLKESAKDYMQDFLETYCEGSSTPHQRCARAQEILKILKEE